MPPFKEVFKINRVIRGFLISQKRTGILEAPPCATTLWASKQCERPDEHVSWRRETVTLVLDPSSEVSHKISMSHISHVFSEAIILAFQDWGKDKVRELIGF